MAAAIHLHFHRHHHRRRRATVAVANAAAAAVDAVDAISNAAARVPSISRLGLPDTVSRSCVLHMICEAVCVSLSPDHYRGEDLGKSWYEVSAEL